MSELSTLFMGLFELCSYTLRKIKTNLSTCNKLRIWKLWRMLEGIRLFSLAKTQRNVVSDFRLLIDCHSMKGGGIVGTMGGSSKEMVLFKPASAPAYKIYSKLLSSTVKMGRMWPWTNFPGAILTAIPCSVLSVPLSKSSCSRLSIIFIVPLAYLCTCCSVHLKCPLPITIPPGEPLPILHDPTQM